MRCVIVGAGIGGLTTANALRDSSMEIVILERAAAVQEVGAGLSLWCNATKALAQLGLESAVGLVGEPIAAVLTLDARGRPLAEIDVKEMDREVGHPSLMVHRAELQRALLDSIGSRADVRLGQTCTSVSWQGRRPVVHLEGGESLAADLLVGADGINSLVRDHVDEAVAPRYAGYTCWRGVARYRWPSQFPSAVTAAAGGSQWGMFRMTGGRCYWYLTRNAAPGEHEVDEREAALRALANWSRGFGEVIHATAPESVLRDDIYDLPPLNTWTGPRTVLLGDAAHATTPNLGQGACQAIEDAVALRASLQGSAHVQTGIVQYQRHRKTRADRVVRRSRQLGRSLQLENRGLVAVRDRLTRRVPRYVRRQFTSIPMDS